MRFWTLLSVCTLIFSCFASGAEYDRITTEMQKIVDSDSNYVEKFDIGENDQKSRIIALRLENRSMEMGAKTNHVLVGTHHGNERRSADLCVKAIQQIVAIMKNPSHKYYNQISSKVFYVVPVLNLGGFNANSRQERDGSGRSLDPNRDYPDPCVKNSYFQLKSINNLVQFIQANNIVASVTVHGYIGTFTYPWGIYTNNTKTSDHALYDSIGRKCCQVNGYRTGTHTDVIYPAAGAYEDWAYHQHGIWTMLLELSSSANLDKDAEAVVTFFALVPDKRSEQHGHNANNCTQTVDEPTARGEEANGRP